MLDTSVLTHYQDFGMPVWVHDPQRHCHVWANAAAVRFWGAASVDELLARRYDDMSPGALARLQVALQAHGRGETTRETWTLYPGGRPTSVVLHGSGIRLADGEQAILYIAEPPVQRDAELLRAAEALLHLPVLVAVHRLPEGRTLMRNPAAVLALGPVEEGRDLGALFLDDRVAATLRAEVGAGRSHRCEAQLLTRAGPCWYAVDAHPAWDPLLGERVLHLGALDIAELKRTQLQLDEARQRAEAASAAKTAFLAHMSHELRTPLNGVLGMLQVALRSPLESRQRHWLEVAQSSGGLLLTLLNDLLDLSRVEAGRLEIEHVPLNLDELLQQTLTPLKVDAEAKGLQWRLQTPVSVPTGLCGDPVRVRQVLFNVVGNAVKFTQQGAIDIEVAVVTAADAGVDLHFRVTDTGIGIEPAHLARLFQPFVQADSSIARRYGGSGLGLALVQRLVELMGGRVAVDSAPGRGTTVRWHLHCRRA